MLTDLEVPDEAYRSRAANNPISWMIPAGVVESAHGIREAVALAATSHCLFTDVSKYQLTPYDASYPYPVASFRFHSGSALDVLASANWAYLKGAIATGRIRVAIAYVVFIPGRLATVMQGVRALFGSTCPTNRLVLMTDMESGAGFAGAGNHSAEANQWAQAFADYTGTSTSWARTIGYANAGDWASNWPQRDARLKRITAAYNAKDPSPWGWQYAGGNPAYPVLAGYPRTAAPWSDRYVDMNVINLTIDQLEQQLAIVTEDPDVPIDGPNGADTANIWGRNASPLPAEPGGELDPVWSQNMPVWEFLCQIPAQFYEVKRLIAALATTAPDEPPAIDYTQLAAALTADPDFAQAIVAAVQSGLGGMGVTSTVISTFVEGPTS